MSKAVDDLVFDAATEPGEVYQVDSEFGTHLLVVERTSEKPGAVGTGPSEFSARLRISFFGTSAPNAKLHEICVDACFKDPWVQLLGERCESVSISSMSSIW